MLHKRLFRFLSTVLGAILFISVIVEALPRWTQLEIRIWTVKDAYLAHEPISVYYRIKNVGDSTFTLYETFDGLKESFNIKDDKNRGYPNTLLAEYTGSSILRPGESYLDSEEIGSRYGVTESGEYTCFLEVYGDKSNVLKIKLTDPKGDEKKALDLYLEAQKLHWCKDRDPEKWEQAFYKYLELVEKYPKSVYAAISLRSALLRSNVIRDKRIVIPVCQKLIENYTNSPYLAIAFLCLAEVYRLVGDKSGAIEYMKELIRKYPNTKISEKAAYWLEKIEKWEFE